MNLPLYLALRYLKGNNKFFLNFWSTFSVLGIFFGVFSILIASSFMGGLKQVMIQALLQKRAHITITSQIDKGFGEEIDELLAEEPRIASFSNVIYTQGVLKSGQFSLGALVCGIDLAKHKEILPFLKALPTKDLSDNQIIVSSSVEQKLNLFLGDKVYLYSTQNTQKTAFGKVPLAAKFSFASSYKADDQILADNLVYVGLAAAKKIAGKNAEKRREIHLFDAYQVAEVIKALQEKLGKSYHIVGWNQEDKAIYDSLKVEAVALNLVLFLIILLAIFNMSGNFLRLVNEKSGEIGVLKAMGIREKQIKQVFIYCGVFIAGLGAGIGVILANGFLFVQHKCHLISIPIQGLGFDYLPVELSYLGGIYVFVLVLLVSLIFSYYPCRRLQKVNPIQVIKE